MIDHVVKLVPDAAETARELRERHGLGSEQGPYLPFAGTRGYNVPLKPPAYLEVLTIEDHDAAERSESGRRALACEAAGFGLIAWAVLVDDLETVSNDWGSRSSTTPCRTAMGRRGDGAQSVVRRICRSSSTIRTTATGSDGGRRCTTASGTPAHRSATRS